MKIMVMKYFQVFQNLGKPGHLVFLRKYVELKIIFLTFKNASGDIPSSICF